MLTARSLPIQRRKGETASGSSSIQSSLSDIDNKDDGKHQQQINISKTSFVVSLVAITAIVGISIGLSIAVLLPKPGVIGASQALKAQTHMRRQRRELVFDDLVIGDFVGNGYHNIVSKVELPDWWYDQEQKDKEEERFVVKLCPGCKSKEVEIFETLWQNETLAKRNRIVPCAYLQSAFDNPFFRDPSKVIPDSFPESFRTRLREEPKLVALVLPYLKLHRPSTQIQSLRGIRRFLKSLLETLEYSHSVGINNFDLNENNFKVDKDGYAVILDWNAAIKQGEKMYHEYNFPDKAPEALIEHANNDIILQTSISAMDIWYVGVELVNLVFQPCMWGVQWHRHKEEVKDILQRTMLSIGGETRIPIGNNKTFDIAPLVGMDRSEVLLARMNFKIPLVKGNIYDPERLKECEVTDFEVLKDASAQDIADLHYFVESAMTISPAERPDATMLLKHPFLNNSIEGHFKDQSEFRHETLAVLVSGAGSSEVNGCYLLKGRNEDAWEFELDNSITGRTFEMFKVDEESGWWNILERVTDDSGSNPPHYGVNGDSDSRIPPVDGWGSVKYNGLWLGKDPMPIVEVTNRDVCLSRKVARRT